MPKTSKNKLAYIAKWRKKKKDRVKVYNQNHYKKNAKKLRDKQKKRYKKNPEYYKDKSKEHRDVKKSEKTREQKIEDYINSFDDE